MEKKISIGTINGTDIFAISSESGEILVPIRPICTALGVDFAAQHTKLKEDVSFSSTIVLSTTVGADGKQREMVCLPHRRVYGWLYTINPGKVASEARESVIKYRDKCNDALYNHFFLHSEKQLEANKAEIALLEEINRHLTAEKESRAKRKEAEKKLDQVRSSRLDDQPTLFD